MVVAFLPLAMLLAIGTDVVSLFTALLGGPPIEVGGVLLWTLPDPAGHPAASTPP